MLGVAMAEVVGKREIQRIPPRCSQPYQFHRRRVREQLLHQFHVQLFLMRSHQQRERDVLAPDDAEVERLHILVIDKDVIDWRR